ncbi:urea ABC transporter permease subunit UrtB [Zwartia sp.]|uniref:urea ABC transporter permease subunit UrtB n=1 Tax=Zwartia sp. TaxID=2978004 RepID=UPI00271A6952|nr:urea ABC transporter permease subunit UrtB [Zwartia sp.]MDO9025233.1 urea ABC transporter permease subunit UrtB [Zwartia sp.]
MRLTYHSFTRWLLAVLLVLPLQLSFAAELVEPQVLSGLAGDNNDERAKSITALGLLSTPGAAAVLAALGDGNVLITSDGKVLLARGDQQVFDPTTGITQARPADAQPLTLNNRLRRALQSALASSELFSPQISIRLAAAQRLQKEADPTRTPLIERALSAERDPNIRRALEVALASAAIKSPDAAIRRDAIIALGESKNAAFKPALLAVVTANSAGQFSEQDESVRAAAAIALKQIEQHQALISWVGNIFFGISLGSVLLLAAIGLAITFGLMGVINMAHGELLMIGAYATYIVQSLFKQWLPGWIDWYVLAALPVAFLVTAIVGMALERTVIRWLYGRPLETLLATWGISLILMQAVRSIFGAQNVEVANPSWMSGGITILGSLTLSYNRLVIIGFAFFVVVIVWLVLNFTRLGLFVRAITQNRRMADCVGVPTGRVDMLAFGLGSGIAGLAGVALSQLSNVGPDLGRGYIVDSFMVVVLGGVGQLAGTVVAALGLGILNKIIEPFWGAVIAKIAILLFIVLFVQKRPQGLFAPKGRSAE